MATLNREQVEAVMRRHGTTWDDNDCSAADVRAYAKYLRFAADHLVDYTDNMVLAAELDLLVDQAEGLEPIEMEATV